MLDSTVVCRRALGCEWGSHSSGRISFSFTMRDARCPRPPPAANTARGLWTFWTRFGLVGLMVRMLAFLKELQDEWRPRGRVEEAAGQDGFGTASERNLSRFLEPFGLQNHADAVWKLARNGGFENAETLHFVDDAALFRLDIADSDRALILLAAWLHLQQLHEYGPGLTANGFVSLTRLKRLGNPNPNPDPDPDPNPNPNPKLTSCTDEAMKRSGIRLMGHRRVLLRQIREELAHREDLAEAPTVSLFTSGAASGVRRYG